MELFLLISGGVILSIIINVIKSNKNISHKQSFLSRFKKRLNSRERLREKLSERFSNSLMSDPESNISIGSWFSEVELREKADIHRARLNKYGRSRMNGEMLFLGPKGGVYKYNSQGKKTYL